MNEVVQKSKEWEKLKGDKMRENTRYIPLVVDSAILQRIVEP